MSQTYQPDSWVGRSGRANQLPTACMATHDVEARLCRWLLRARDLSGDDVLLFTQEFLAEMLGCGEPA